MNLITNLIKNNKFDTAINSKLLKHSQEYRVLATLRYLFPSKYMKMIKAETPDLQDVENSIGIEVTAAVKENDMKASRALSELCRKDCKEYRKYKDKIETSGYSTTIIEKNKILISATGTSDLEKSCFYNSIGKKNDKLQEYRKCFERIGIAIILVEIPTKYTENHLTEWICELIKCKKIQFDFFYVISYRFCVYYDVKERGYKKFQIAPWENEAISIMARLTAENRLTLTDEEWM